MQDEKNELSSNQADGQESASTPTSGKESWQEPKLAFVEPKLTKHGSLEEVTGGGFFGGFTPG